MVACLLEPAFIHFRTFTARPGMFDLAGKAKWDAWDGKKGKKKHTIV